MKQSELDQIKTFKEAMDKYDLGEINVDELSDITQRLGVDTSFWEWNMAVDANPDYPDGNEDSRVKNKWNVYHSMKGKFYQRVIKKALFAAINMVHNYTIERYNKDQFIYDDVRLKRIDSFAKKYVDENFRESKGYKDTFMKKIIDITLGTIAKEDIYYRARMFDMINKFIKEFGKDGNDAFELTQIERENIDRWH